MPPLTDLSATLLTAWRTNSRVTAYLVEHPPAALWDAAVPGAPYVWRNLPLDVPHVLTYFVVHEGHHRGQIVMLARQLAQPGVEDYCGGAGAHAPQM